MADVFMRDKRSSIMRAVKSTLTTPELIVQEFLHGLGYRPMIDDASLPGRPDLAFPEMRLAIFVHGCFWHRHRCPAGQSMPASNQDYWLAKFRRNRRRDRKVRRELREAGWKVLTIWECETRKSRRDSVFKRIARRIAEQESRSKRHTGCDGRLFEVRELAGVRPLFPPVAV